MDVEAASVNLSIKGVPGALAEALRARARANHRSLQGELMAMLEAHVGARPFRARWLLEQARAAGLHPAAEAVDMIRADRDAR
jgi:plasmid stability protein